MNLLRMPMGDAVSSGNDPATTLAALEACCTPPIPSTVPSGKILCQNPNSPSTVVEITIQFYFGLRKNDGTQVTSEEFDDFVATVIIP